MDTFDPNDSWVQEIRQRMVPGGQVRDLPQYPADDIKKGQNHDKIEKALGNITASCVARTRPMNYPPAKDRWVSCATGASVVSCSRQLVLPVSTGLTTKVPPVPGVLD